MKRGVAVTVAALGAVALLPGCDNPPGRADPDLVCNSRPAQVLAAQSVPSAQYVPCITNVLQPWMLESTDTDQDRTEIHLQWTGAESGSESAVVTLRASCDAPEDVETPNTLVPSDINVTSSTQNRTVSTFYEFEGGCVVAEVQRAPRRTVEAISAEDFTVQLVPREELDAFVREQTDGYVGLDAEDES